ncbi:MAG: phosphoserine phosphatase SerB [Acetobacteraceae bacterium]|nr:phosphoserine phosphatase SerB [Acetobacteraceae bacterium]MDW8399756.1 phosphoserine phosphatase SerB [Acetobacteraceae bacterium]
MPHCLTLIARPGALSPDHAAAAREALRALGALTGGPDWLSEAEACDIPFEQLSPDQATAAARAALGGAPVDAIATPRAGRRKRLLLADMDSTIVEGETLDELAAHAGLKEKIAAITARSMNGEIDFATALRERVAMLKGLPVAALERTWEGVRDTPGAAELVATMRANGAACVLVSGGFTFFTARVAARLGFDSHLANVLEVEGDVLAGRVQEPILDRDAKLAALKRLSAERGLPLSATAAVGDGANDLAMLAAAGLGVAWRAKPVVAAAARARLDHADLTGLLFAQGYRRSEFVAR